MPVAQFSCIKTRPGALWIGTENSLSNCTHFVIHEQRADTMCFGQLHAGMEKRPTQQTSQENSGRGLWWLGGERRRLTGNPAAIGWPTPSGNSILHPFSNGRENEVVVDRIAVTSTRGDTTTASDTAHAAECQMYYERGIASMHSSTATRLQFCVVQCWISWSPFEHARGFCSQLDCPYYGC